MRKIYLTRHNHLATYSSAEIARQFEWTNRRLGEDRGQRRIQIAEKDFERHIAGRERHHSTWGPLIRSYGGCEISYGEARTADSAARLWTYLEVDPGKGGTSDLIKTNSEELLDRFENKDAVLSWLERNGRKDWLLPEA